MNYSVEKKKIYYLKLIYLFFEDLSCIAKIFSYDAIDCFIKLSEQEKYSKLDFIVNTCLLYSKGDNLREIWKAQINQSNLAELFDCEVSDMLISFSEIFGKKDIEDFVIKCKMMSSYFFDKYTYFEKKYEKSTKTSVGISMLTAIAVFIILI